MTQKDKTIQRFLNSPTAFKYIQIEKILLNLGFEKIHAKGSHHKFKHILLENDLIIPVHSNDCKIFYKKLAAKLIKQHRLYN